MKYILNKNYTYTQNIYIYIYMYVRIIIDYKRRYITIKNE